MRLQDKVAIVTGAGAGVGKAIALRYAREGARVVVAEIDETSGQSTTAEIVAGGLSAIFVRADLSRLEDIEALMKRSVAAFGRIDVLMNNAGVTRKLDFFEVTAADWDWIHSVNAKGAFFCMQAAAREMAGRREGKIINIASIAGKGFRGTSNVAYAASKGAVIAMTRVAASQLAPYNINVNSICPGVTRTALYARIVEGVAEREKISVADATARMDASIPLKRSNNPDDIAHMAVFLASDEARNITGQSFNVDGGIMWD
ncbi:MAG TPA: glucose 1-dehydrogenase [Candidatus Methylomirabilis sp.]|nr:glucose 1-dehydrogenase [Candidatus Methylomirabilis sp.]